MNLEKIIKFIFILSSCGLISVGNFYDDRLIFFGINISFVISGLYVFSLMSLLIKVRDIKFSISKFILYTFFLLVIVLSPILWLIFEVNQYGVIKYLTFLFITVPISVVILELFTERDMNFMIWVLFSVSFLLMFLGYQNFESAKDLQGQRMAVLGGGPIVFGRWLMFGSLILLFHPNVKKIYKFLIVPLFIFMAFAAGSRGPMYSFVLIISFYLFFTFRHNFSKIFSLSILVCLIFSSLFLFDKLGIKTVDIHNTYIELGNPAKRMSDPTLGGYARIDRIDRSINLVMTYPLGVGIGNWAKETNRFSDLHHRDKEYAHNIVLELANESGIIVAIVFLILIFSVLSSAFNNFQLVSSSSYLTLFFILFMYMLINTFISGDLMDSRFLFIFLSFFLSYSINYRNILESS